MTFNTPSFWYRKSASPAPWQERVLGPLSCLYHCGHRVHQALRKSARCDVPVLCVGNAVAGGSGKTPAALALCKLLQTHKPAYTPAFLTRGYGGTEAGPVCVSDHDDFKAVGDESLLLARSALTVVSRNRPAGARLAAAQGADLILMDDGLQNRSLHKDLSFMVIDGASGFGNGRLLPAGPLRERLDDAFAKTGAFIMVGKDLRDTALSLPRDKPLFRARVEPRLPPDLDMQRPYIAFAGLGRPEKFYHLLQHLGINIAGWHGFPDHHAYDAADIQMLGAEAKARNTGLLTTEKDAVRLSGLQADIPIQTLPIEIVFEDEQEVVDFLQSTLKLA